MELLVGACIFLAILLAFEVFCLYIILKLINEALKDARSQIADAKEFANEKQKFLEDKLDYLKRTFPLFFG